MGKEIGKMKLEAFGLEENARNWRTWRFIDGIDEMAFPKTDSAIDYTFDTRLHFEMSDDKIDAMANVIHRSLDSIRQPVDDQEPEGKVRSNETPSLERCHQLGRSWGISFGQNSCFLAISVCRRAVVSAFDTCTVAESGVYWVPSRAFSVVIVLMGMFCFSLN